MIPAPADGFWTAGLGVTPVKVVVAVPPVYAYSVPSIRIEPVVSKLSKANVSVPALVILPAVIVTVAPAASAVSVAGAVKVIVPATTVSIVKVPLLPACAAPETTMTSPA